MVGLVMTGPCINCPDIDLDMNCLKYTSDKGMRSYYTLRCKHDRICMRLRDAGELEGPKQSWTSGGATDE